MNDRDLFSIQARQTHPKSSHAECRRQNKNLTPSMKFALKWIKAYPGQTANMLECIVGCPPGRIWKVLAQMERRGLIKRVRNGSKPMRIYPA
ncbi:MAG: MarR family winged helix-turn-helix transcriptional regulator [Desulfobacteraceae bacterium]|jgi:uncharacterized membrane protein